MNMTDQTKPENSPQSLQMEEAADFCYVKMMKVAAAIACIRSKPDHMTAVEYTQQLCDKFQIRQLTWQEKFEAQEREILQLKQDMLLTFLRCENKSVAEEEYDLCDDDSCALLTPPSSGTRTCSNEMDTHLYKDIIDRHRAFLQCTVTLQSAASSQSLKVDEVTKSTILHSLKVIHDCIVQSENDLSMKSILPCLNIIHKLLDCNKVTELPPLMDGILNIIEAAVKRILEGTQVTEKKNFVKLIACTIHPHILIPGLSVLVSKIDQFSDHLRQVCKKSTSLDPDLYENMFYVIKILEDSIMKYRTVLHTKHVNFVNFLIEKMDDALLHLTVMFPLYAHAIWKIHAILSHILVT